MLNHLHQQHNALVLDDQPLISDLPNGVTAIVDPLGVGIFLHFTDEKMSDRHVMSLGNIRGVERYTCGYRYDPFWMTPQAGEHVGEIPTETQYLLLELTDGRCVLCAPLIDSVSRASLQGAGEDALEIVWETNDAAIQSLEMTGLFIAVGANPYVLFPEAAASVSSFLKTGKLRREKPPPDFIDDFGWCTWDAFYGEVSHDKVRLGLQSFADGGVQPKYLILDDGWQSTQKTPTGESRLTAFAANEKFPGDLTNTTRMAKDEFGLDNFFVWHAVIGYWGGVDGAALPGYGVRDMARSYSEVIEEKLNRNHGWGLNAGVVAPEMIYKFYQNYHRHLREQGVDGVKVDNQANLEGLCKGLGGRMAMMRSYHEALEGSVHVHFGGNLINCMSDSNDMLYSALNSNLVRTSTDFWPNVPSSHGLHLYINAQVTAWFGEFLHPDWDMFQSGHQMGAYHAAGRAVGGCPVYVSDKPDAHNFDVLRKLVLPNGQILRASDLGRPTRDCLFHNPTKENVLLKIFNSNDTSGVIGVFNARYSDSGEDLTIAGSISPSDIDLFTGGDLGNNFIVYAHNTRQIKRLGLNDRWEISLPTLSFELFTVVPIDEGIAPIGFVDMYNSGGAIGSNYWDDEGFYEFSVESGCRCWIWSERAPARLELAGEPTEFQYNSDTQILEFTPDSTESLGYIGRIFFE